MEGKYTGKEVFERDFDPKEYLKSYYSYNPSNPADKEFLTFTLNKLHKAFIEDGIKGDTLIDIGCGPTIYQYLSACESFRSIIATDYTDQNREEMQRWLRKEPDAFDWSPVVKDVCELEGNRETWKEKEEKVRRAVRQVLKCDVTNANPLAPQVMPQVTCVLTCFCLETACKDLAAYRAALKNISSLITPGGHLILMSTLQETFFMVGRHWFFCLYLEEDNITDAVREAGFDIVWSDMCKAQFNLSVADNNGIYAVVAQKRSKS